MRVNSNVATMMAVLAVLAVVLRPPPPRTKAAWGHLAVTGVLIKVV